MQVNIKTKRGTVELSFEKLRIFRRLNRLEERMQEEEERVKAFAKLLELIHASGDSMDVGVLGGRVIFHVLSEFGYSDLAYKMITKEEYPSYGNWVKRGATTLWENFLPDSVFSMNHQFWGDVSAWFIKRVAGINLNPEGNDVSRLLISPSFVEALDSASAYHLSPCGKISVSWRKEGEKIFLDVTVPDRISTIASLPEPFVFEGGESRAVVRSGSYKIVRKK